VPFIWILIVSLILTENELNKNYCCLRLWKDINSGGGKKKRWLIVISELIHEITLFDMKSRISYGTSMA